MTDFTKTVAECFNLSGDSRAHALASRVPPIGFGVLSPPSMSTETSCEDLRSQLRLEGGPRRDKLWSMGFMMHLVTVNDWFHWTTMVSWQLRTTRLAIPTAKHDAAACITGKFANRCLDKACWYGDQEAVPCEREAGWSWLKELEGRGGAACIPAVAPES